jgi:lipopolysaccharide export system protein LptA
MMKNKYLKILLLITLTSLTSNLFAAQYASPDGVVVLKASSIEVSALGVIAKGNVHLESIDKVSKSELKADAKEIKITFYDANKKGLSGLDAIKSAEITGRMHLEYSTTDVSGNNLKSTADADKAIYSGDDKLMHLNGNVNITHNNPSVFGAPATANGDNAIINLNKKLAPETAKFKIESNSEPSTIEFTPKKEAGKTK